MSYYMLLCTEWLVYNPEEVRYRAGFVMVPLIIFVIILNLVLNVASSTDIYLKVRKRFRFEGKWNAFIKKKADTHKVDEGEVIESLIY